MFACRPKQKVRKLRGPIARLVGLLGVLTLISLTAGEAAAASRYQAAAVPAKPGLQCTLSPDKTSTAAAAVTVSWCEAISSPVPKFRLIGKSMVFVDAVRGD
jgi:hypothetical protein